VTTAVTSLVAAQPMADVTGAFVAEVADAFSQRPGPRFGLVLSGGALAGECYERLAASPGTLDWTVVDVYIGDERFVPADDADANQRLIKETLLDRVGPVGSFSPMPTRGAIEECAAAYATTVAAALDGPGFDLIHMGLGPDGHTASLFPGAPTLEAPADQLVAATEDPNGRNPHPRLTLTLPAIDRARRAVITVTGQDKQAAIDLVRHGASVPGALLDVADTRWLVDIEAFG
jgi:6-phosphogluconolactonase